ncbi:MAG: N-6 DNA methylase, partial [Chloroflexota bacterium]
MPRTAPHYNERAWAIDLISEINAYCAARSRAIVRAGGEYSLTGPSGCLFPDVLLFGDHSGAAVQQGWELKMPDTAINDRQLLTNAEQKARRLGLNSFLVWNVNEAALYSQNSSGTFTHKKTWPATGITRRADVAQNRALWVRLLHTIIDDVNNFLDRGDIAGARPEVAISDVLFLDYLEHFTPSLSRTIKHAYQINATFAAELKLWWAENKTEHPGCTEFEGLARVNIINWVNRILFAHYLKRFNNAARAVESIASGTSVQDAIRIFDTISASCDFLNVFKPALGQKHIDPTTWNGLIHLNCFLKDLTLGAVTQESFHSVIETALTYARKKLAGQFSTPRPLADLLVRLAVHDRTKPVFDPCCGTGTIARAAYDLKRSVGLDTTEALGTTWASDKFAFPLQLCSIALSDPLAMGEVVQVFRHDAFTIASGESIKFTDPSSGAEVTRNLPTMHAAISNLPFVRFEDNEKLNPSLTSIKATLTQNCAGGATLEGRADLYAYLVFKLRELVEEHGRVGIISSNSWLAVEWGEKFREILSQCFSIKQVIVSGEGRWFDNSDVV